MPGPAIKYISTDCNVNISSRFTFKAMHGQTQRQTHIITYTTDHPNDASATAGVRKLSTTREGKRNVM